MGRFDASRWAEALFAAAGDDAEEAGAVLAAVRDGLYGKENGRSPDAVQTAFRPGLLSASAAARRLEVALEGLIPSGSAGRGAESARRFVVLLARKGRLGGLDEILTQFGILLDARKGIVRATIETAQPMGASEREKVRALIKGRYKAASVELTEKLNLDLIGGLRIRVGWKELDGSIQGKLSALASAMGAKKRGVHTW
jgi:F-type H+-transporting ATPase subunit delta